MTKSTRKRHLEEVLSLSTTRMKKPRKPSATPEIVFSSSDFKGVVPGHDDPMIILAKMVNAEVKRAFIDQGSSAGIIFQDSFDKLGLKILIFRVIRKNSSDFLEKRYTRMDLLLCMSLWTADLKLGLSKSIFGRQLSIGIQCHLR